VLKERERCAAAVLPAGADLYRITLTAPLINQAAMVAFLVAGGAKAGVLRKYCTALGTRRGYRPSSSSRTTANSYGWWTLRPQGL